VTALAGQLELLPLTHETEVYPCGSWWAWRCTCGRDPGAEGLARWSHEDLAARMAGHHRGDWAFGGVR
jgi:hypothetical protein